MIPAISILVFDPTDSTPVVPSPTDLRSIGIFGGMDSRLGTKVHAAVSGHDSIE